MRRGRGARAPQGPVGAALEDGLGAGAARSLSASQKHRC